MISLGDVHPNADWILVFTIVAYVAALAWRSRGFSISHIQGPTSGSLLLGSLPELLKSPAGSADLKWQKQFGLVYRLRTVLRRDRLMIADPKAIQTVLGSTYTFHRPMKAMFMLLVGPGVVLSEGDAHKRQRRAMNPAFAAGPLKALLPLFTHVGTTLSAQWKNTIEDTKEKTSTVINVAPWLARATLDALGRAAFDYNFESLKDDKNDLARAYNGLFLETDSQLSGTFILVRELLCRLPDWIATPLFNHLPTSGRAKTRHMHKTTMGVARSLIDDKIAARERGEALAKDVMSLMVHANQSADAKNRLEDHELMAQMGTLILAGHDTTAYTVTWTLYSIAREPVVQSKVRKEIASVRARALERGEEGLTIRDFEAMVYLSAVMREVLRLYPVVPSMDRMASVDTVLPLTRPLVTRDGNSINELAIGKGQFMTISIIGYNLSEEIWGSDVMEFKPERWLDDGREKKALPQVGMFSNLMTFGSGPKGCIGWRFSMIEMQALLVELLSTFEFAIPANAKPIQRESALVMLPIVEDEREKGAQMLLEVKVLDSD